MSRVLKRTVLAGGVIYPAGTPATSELEKAIPAKFWDGDAAPAGDTDESGATGAYKALKVDELKAEIAKRNEDRAEDNQLSTEGKKDDLIATLTADDEHAEG